MRTSSLNHNVTAHKSSSGSCNAHIGMGVRYNAEKKKIGMYYSTPIFSFRCKCHLCSGWFEIQTDPQVRLTVYSSFPRVNPDSASRAEYALRRCLWRPKKGRRLGPS